MTLDIAGQPVPEINALELRRLAKGREGVDAATAQSVHYQDKACRVLHVAHIVASDKGNLFGVVIKARPGKDAKGVGPSLAYGVQVVGPSEMKGLAE